MKFSFFNFFIVMFFVLFIVTISSFSIEYLGVLCVNQRIDSGISYAGWSGFYYYDLERYAVRKDLSKREYRNIYLEDSVSVREAIKKKIVSNLKLNEDMTPRENGFLEDTVELIEINIYNPDVLPVTIEGKEYDVTTIEIVTRVILKPPLGDKKSYIKRTIVNANTFLIDEQKE